MGDLSYADGYQPRWDSWGRLVEPLAAALPIMHTEGNHEEEVSLLLLGASREGGKEERAGFMP